MNALTQRAQSLLNDKSIDAESRAILRHALETNDPWLAEMVRRADAGDTIIDATDFRKHQILIQVEKRSKHSQK